MTGDRAMESRSGFSAVDRSADPGRWIAYLDRVRDDPQWRKAKRRSLEKLALQPGETVLEVGCGTGEDLVALADATEGTGRAIGVDLSAVMVAEAKVRHHRGQGTFLVADALDLPFPDGSFDACRVERTLQHTSDSAKAVAELARVLGPGGRVVADEPDWTKVVFDTPFAAVGRRIYQDIVERHPAVRIGSELASMLARAGLIDVTAEAWEVRYTTLAAAAANLHLKRLARAASDQGVVPAAEADGWLASLRDADRRGCFFASVTMVTAVARKSL